MTQGDVRYDGCDAREIAAQCGVPQVELFRQIGSTLDVAHERAGAGAPAGALVLAEEQTAGRGRQGRSWVSEPAGGIWLTLVERHLDPIALPVLSLRLGLYAARALDPFADGPVGLKWPNDLYLAGRKLAGILVEARWRQGRLDWIAVGFGINVRMPQGVPAAALRAGVRRLEVLACLVPALRAAAAVKGGLTDEERASYGDRDVARGRTCHAPLSGVVSGIDAEGALLVRTSHGIETARAGSLLLVEDV